MPITFPKETEAQLLASIKRFAAEELDLDVGHLRASLLLDFFVKEIGPSIHNAALDEAQRFMAEKAEDLPNARHEPEFGYWPLKSK